MPSHERDSVFRLDRAQLRASFDRASAGYDAAAILQARIGDELIERLELFNLEPRVVLDLGAGTGRGTRALHRLYPQALIIALDIAPGMLHLTQSTDIATLCADTLRIPLSSASVDLVFSNLMLQWCDDLQGALNEVRRVLKPRGFFAFSTFGPDTLRELRAAWAAADAFTHVNRFIDMHDVGDAVLRAGLAEPVLDVERTQVTYDDVMTLMRDLKSIGAHNVTAGRPRTLTGRGKLDKVRAAYENFRKEGRLPATYEVIYGAAWGGAERQAAGVMEGEVRIPPGAIRHRT